MVLNLHQIVASAGNFYSVCRNMSQNGSGGGAGSALLNIRIGETKTVNLKCGVGGAGSASNGNYGFPVKIGNNSANGQESSVSDIIVANGGAAGTISDAGGGGSCTIEGEVETAGVTLAPTPGSDGKTWSYGHTHEGVLVEGGIAAINKSIRTDERGNGSAWKTGHGGWTDWLKSALATCGKGGYLKIVYRGTRNQGPNVR